MPRQLLSMREASRVLGVSQLRVRELIRKGKIRAEKVTDAAGERWAIVEGSVQDYLTTRPPRPETSNGQAQGGPTAPTADTHAVLSDLLRGLEEHLAKVRSLLQEISRAERIVEDIRRARRSLEDEATRRRNQAPDGAAPEGELHPARAAEMARRALDAARKAVEAAKAGGGKQDRAASDADDSAPEAPVRAKTPKASTAKAPAKTAAAAKGEPKVSKAKADAKPRTAKATRTGSAAPAKGKASRASEGPMAAALRQAGVKVEAASERKPAKKK